MKNANVKLIQRFLFLVVSIFLLDLSSTYGQIGQLGIYGSAPEAVRANVRYVRLDDYPVDMAVGYVLPVNGLSNFNFFYSRDGTGFLAGGGYKVTYLGADQTTSYGYDIVTYKPNKGNTNGVQVRPFNSPPAVSLGIHDTVYARSGDIVVPLVNAVVFAIPLFGSTGTQVRTNADGYFSLYYANENPDRFLPVFATPPSPPPHEFYDIYISGTLNGCSYSFASGHILWEPFNSSNPNLPNYFVFRSDPVVDVPILLPMNCH